MTETASTPPIDDRIAEYDAIDNADFNDDVNYRAQLDWENEPTNAANRELVWNSYAGAAEQDAYRPSEGVEVVPPEDAVDVMRANALADFDYYQAGAAAAEQLAPGTLDGDDEDGYNKSLLREALRIDVPSQPEKPYDTSSPELTDEEKATFGTLLGRIEQIGGSERLGYRNADHRAKQWNAKGGEPQSEDQEDRYWNGAGGKPGRLHQLSTELNKFLEANPRYFGMVQDHLDTLADRTSGAQDRRRGPQEKVDTMRTIAERDAAARDDPTADDRLERLTEERKGLLADPRRQSWYKRRFDENSTKPVVGIVSRAIGGMRSTRRKETKLHIAATELTRGKGSVDPHGFAHRTVPDPDSINGLASRHVRAAQSELRARTAETALEASDFEYTKASMQLDTLREVVAEARRQQAGERFAERHGRLEDVVGAIQAHLATAHDNYVREEAAGKYKGSVRVEDDYNLFTSLTGLGQYIDDLDEARESLDPSLLSSRNQLIAMRNLANLAYIRAYYRAEELHIVSKFTPGTDSTEEYFGQYGSRLLADNGIQLQRDGIILYEDGTIYDPRSASPRRRHADGHAA